MTLPLSECLSPFYGPAQNETSSTTECIRETIVKSTSSISATHQKILDFAYAYPATCFHIIDMLYRLCSPAAQDEANIKLWTDATGELIGFALLQFPFSSLDWAVRPDHDQLHNEIIAWGVARLEEVAGQRPDGFGYLLDSRSDNNLVATRHGFALDDWTMRSLALELLQPPPIPQVPAEFLIRPIQGQEEVAAYVDLHRAAFQSRNMTTDWRMRILAHPSYVQSLDLVIEDMNEKLAAFCIGWLGEISGMLVGQIEPLGVLPNYQGQGLGRAILAESLQRFHRLGVQRIFIDAESNNPASQHLYESFGFRDFTHTYKYFRRF
jgi:mycothiol synthase